MKCELCGKKINAYGRYTETIAGKEGTFAYGVIRRLREVTRF